MATLARGRDRFEAWRRTRQAGTRIPGELWSLAVKLTDGHGLSRTASGLDYYSLRKRVAAWKSGETSVPSAFVEDSTSARPAFIDLSSSLQSMPSLGVSNECVVAFEDGAGARLRVHRRGSDAPDLVACELVYDGQGFWLCHQRLSEGRFHWWPSASDQTASGENVPGQDARAKALAAHQLSVLFSAGDPDRTSAAPDWRPVGPRR